MRVAGKPLSELASNKGRQESPQCDRMPSSRSLLSAFFLAGDCPTGQVLMSLRDGTCLDPSKDPLKAALSPPPTQDLPNQIKLLSSLHTLKVWLLAD